MSVATWKMQPFTTKMNAEFPAEHGQTFLLFPMLFPCRTGEFPWTKSNRRR